MALDPIQFSPMFRIDVSAEPDRANVANASNVGEATLALLHQLVVLQQRQNQLLEQLANVTLGTQKQRNTELQNWKDANSELSTSCHRAAEVLSNVHSEFLEQLTREIEDQEDNLMDGEYVLNEFVDRYGPRLIHLNGVLQILSQLGTQPQ